MQTTEESLRNQIALGWVIELLLVVLMLVVMIIDSVMMDNNFFSLHADPGGSLSWMVYLFGVYALMPVYVHLVHGWKPRAGRWLAVVLAALALLFFLLHHLSHWQAGQRLTLSSHVLDVTLHLVGLWVLVSSIRWARSPRAATP
jgi:hypothetical protein